MFWCFPQPLGWGRSCEQLKFLTSTWFRLLHAYGEKGMMFWQAQIYQLLVFFITILYVLIFLCFSHSSFARDFICCSTHGGCCHDCLWIGKRNQLKFDVDCNDKCANLHICMGRAFYMHRWIQQALPERDLGRVRIADCDSQCECWSYVYVSSCEILGP